ncbi:hypothetical protein HWV62_30609 [Athelia sp. TMB]|nr:hypothetical protein HWV62_30609 [Athelia sp. TMB]
MRTYDVFYSLTPFTQALCAKNGDGAYCATEATSSSSSAINNNVDAVVAPGSSASSLKQFLWSTTGSSSAKRATAETAAIIPNVTTYRDSNLLFFFLQPDTPSATLCTPCARSAMLSYMQFEASVPYAPGLVNSVLMGGQSALYTAMNTTCGATFFTGGVSAVGGIASGMLGGSGTSAAPRTIGQNAGVTVALLAGAAVFAGFML